MSTAGIAIDAWKLPIFERHLTQSGYAFENKGKLLEGTLLLMVETENLVALREVVTAANKEAARTRGAGILSTKAIIVSATTELVPPTTKGE